MSHRGEDVGADDGCLPGQNGVWLGWGFNSALPERSQVTLYQRNGVADMSQFRLLCHLPMALPYLMFP